MRKQSAECLFLRHKKIALLIEDKIDVHELKKLNVIKEQNTFSKKMGNLIDRNTYNSIKLGNEIHECLEFVDLLNPNFILSIDSDDLLLDVGNLRKIVDIDYWKKDSIVMNDLKYPSLIFLSSELK